jgi:pyridoxamine 5'-phosphate oxidase
MSNPYLAKTFPDLLPDDPMTWAEAWLQAATDEAVQRNPNSMTVVTVDGEGQPSARVVLCKSFVADPGYVVFYTNYKSRKIAELRDQSKVAATFHWDALGRQIRLEGVAVFSPVEESDEYFAGRDWGSQIGAWGSDQSAPLESRQALRKQIRDRARAIGVDVSDDLRSVADDENPIVARPLHWGGIRIWPTTIELWVEGADRIHDRAVWTRTMQQHDEHSFNVTTWHGRRLQP